jgi:hypothetical protein
VMTGNVAQVFLTEHGHGPCAASAPRFARAATWSSRPGVPNAGPGLNGPLTSPRSSSISRAAGSSSSAVRSPASAFRSSRCVAPTGSWRTARSSPPRPPCGSAAARKSKRAWPPAATGCWTCGRRRIVRDASSCSSPSARTLRPTSLRAGRRCLRASSRRVRWRARAPCRALI